MMRTASLVSAAVSLAVLLLAPIGGDRDVDASHTSEHNTAYLVWNDYTTPNVVIGEPIRVCTTQFANAAGEAISIWNNSTAGYASTNLFVLSDSLSDCETKDDTKVSGVTVKWDPTKCSAEGLACVSSRDGFNDDLGVFAGRLYVFSKAYQPSISNDPHDYRFPLLVRDIAHELGHVLGLQHYLCEGTSFEQVDNELFADVPMVMNKSTGVADCTVTRTGNMRPRLTDVDLMDFLNAYPTLSALLPSAPTGLTATAGDGTITLIWNQAEDVPAIDGYQYSLAGGAWEDMRRSSDSTTTHELAGLRNGDSYEVRVRAVRGSKWSRLSDAVSATPRGPPATLTTNVQPVGSGTVSVSPSAAGGVYDAGTAVTLTAETSNAYFFSRWRIIANDVTTTTCLNPVTVTMDHHTTAVAVFEELVGPAPAPSVRLTIQLIRDVDPGVLSQGITINGVLCESATASASNRNTRAAPGVSVTVTITRVGATTPVATLGPVTADASGAWSVQVPPKAPYITDGTFNVVATATRGSVTATATSQFTANVAPSVSYNTVPTSMRVGTAITDIVPTTSDEDIASYALKAGSTLPLGLGLNTISTSENHGVISGTPRAATAAGAVTIVVTDRAGNTSDVTLSLPAVIQPPPPPTDPGGTCTEWGYSWRGTPPRDGLPTGGNTGGGFSSSSAAQTSLDTTLEVLRGIDYTDLGGSVHCWTTAPTVVTIHIPAGELINIIWPGATVRVATAAASLPDLTIWWYDPDAEEWVFFRPGAPDFANTNFLLRTGGSYSIRSQLEVDYEWRVVAASAGASSTAPEDAPAEPASDAGWSALVTCDSGFSPVRLGVAPTEAEAISAAQWFIESPSGCGGAGTYTVSYRP